MACLAGCVFGLAGLAAGRLAWLYIHFDVFAQFTAHFALIAAAFALGFLMPRGRVLSACVTIVAGLVAIGLLPHLAARSVEPAAAAGAGERAVKIMSFNTWFSNTRNGDIAAEIERNDPDIAMLAEFGPDKRPILARLKARWPHSIDCLKVDYCNLVILSKFPIIASEGRADWQGPPLIRAMFGPELGGLVLTGTHTIRFPHQRAQLRQFDALVRDLETHAGKPLAVMGDFNATPFSRMVQGFETATGLTRLTYLPTWPARLQLPQLGIDQVFVSSTIRKLSEPRNGRSVGSDHFPVLVTVAVPLGASP